MIGIRKRITIVSYNVTEVGIMMKSRVVCNTCNAPYVWINTTEVNIVA